MHEISKILTPIKTARNYAVYEIVAQARMIKEIHLYCTHIIVKIFLIDIVTSIMIMSITPLAQQIIAL